MARREKLDRTEICVAGCWQAAGAAELWTGQAVQPLYEMPCGEVFDMHGPEAVLMHVPHVNDGAARVTSAMMHPAASYGML